MSLVANRRDDNSLELAFNDFSALFPEISDEKKEAAFLGERNLFEDFLNPNRKERLSVTQALALNREEALKREYLFDYKAYDKVLKFMTAEMNKNANGPEAKEIRELFIKNPLYYADPNSPPFKLFKKLVTDPNKWDYKRLPEFRELTIRAKKNSGSGVRITPIRGDKKYLYSYDIWGNIHYGFVGMACGITRAHLYIGSMENDYDSFSDNIEKDVSGNIKDSIIDNIFEADPVGALSDVFENIVSIPSRAVDAFWSSLDDSNSVQIGIQLADNHGKTVSKSAVHNAIISQKMDWDEGVTKFKLNQLKLVK